MAKHYGFVGACLRYGDLKARDVRGVVLESFGVGNMPDLPRLGWIPWLKKTVKSGIKVGMLLTACTDEQRLSLYQAKHQL